MINEKRIREKLRLKENTPIFLLVCDELNGIRYGFIYSIVNGDEVKGEGVLISPVKENMIRISDPHGIEWANKNLGRVKHIGKKELTIETPKFNHIKF